MALSYTTWRWPNSQEFQVLPGRMVQCLIAWLEIPHSKGMDDKYHEEALHHESERLGKRLKAPNCFLTLMSHDDEKMQHLMTLTWRLFFVNQCQYHGRMNIC